MGEANRVRNTKNLGGEGQTEWGAPKTWDGRDKQGKEHQKHGRGGANRVRGTKDMGWERQTG